MTLPIELEQEDDGRWFGVVDELPGVMAYGATREEAAKATRALALRVLAERIEHGEELPESLADFMAVRT
ncbi:MAG TPA: type II toxin-antitoxin system HicB family antitoxin [Urbifossiella sp.]|nr:type II toxin-antitoxin system HicB family antitoxin [Urbifossiella sp.]